MIFVVALGAAGWALWCRRMTWRFYWENAATATVLLQGMALVLMTPWSSATLGRWLYYVVGQNNLEDWMGHCCALGATASFLMHMMIRLHPMNDVLRAEYHRKVNLPLTFTVPVTLALLWHSPVADGYYDDFLSANPDLWLGLYWLVFFGVLLYMIGALNRMLVEVRTDHRSRKLANLYLVATMLAASSCILGIAAVVIDYDAPQHLMMILGCTSITVFSLGCGYSWHCKLQWFYATQQLQRRE